MSEVTFHELDSIDETKLKYAIVISQYRGQWIFCKHKQRETFELPGGHREGNESIYDAAKRELFEETGAVEFELTPICICSIQRETEFFGMLYYAQVEKLELLPDSEIERIEFFKDIPDNLTYSYTPHLFNKCLSHIKTYKNR